MGDLKHVYTEGFSEIILPCYDYYFIQFWKRKKKICCLRCLCTNDTEKWKGILLLLANYCISFINPNLRSIFRRCLYTICSKSQCPLFHLLQNAKLRESNLRWNMEKKNPPKNVTSDRTAAVVCVVHSWYCRLESFLCLRKEICQNKMVTSHLEAERVNRCSAESNNMTREEETKTKISKRMLCLRNKML